MADEKGLYISWDFKFGGLKVIVTAKINVKGESSGGRRDLPNAPKPKEDKFIDAGDKYEFVLIKESDTWTMAKTYFNKDQPVNTSVPK